MREIKFRAINHETGEFVYGYYVKILEGIRWIHYIIDGDTKYYIHDLKTLGQFTGLKDKNGKEVYEGDIVSYTDKDDPEDNYVDVLIWEEHGYTTKKNGIWSSFPKGYEVIGNIYENKELLDASLGDGEK